jgi:HAD superfamily hydrolase (TIGR01509 family)
MASLQPIELIICDFDNTLVDSEQLNAELFAEFFQAFAGINSDADDHAFVDSAAFPEVIRHYRSKYDLRLQAHPESELIEQFLRFKARRLPEIGLRAATGIEELLELPVAKAIVSGSYAREIKAGLEAAGLSADAFALVLGSDEYSPWKPDPAGLLLAASRLARAPGHTAVLEDSISGLTAARNAGMQPVFIAEFSAAAWNEASPLSTWAFATVGEFVGFVRQAER